MSFERKPIVAGTFYPETEHEIREMIKTFMTQVNTVFHLSVPKAIIVPHAGYEYSGLTAAFAYATLKQGVQKTHRVLIFAPSHRYPFAGIATTGAEAYRTPLGRIPIDRAAVSLALSSFPYVQTIESAFDEEHALEVQLPFLQTVLKDFSIIPFIVGMADIDQVAQIMKMFLNDPKTLIVVSSDLSHYLDYRSAQMIDKKTAEAILSLQPENISFDQACGRIGIQGLLKVAKEKGLTSSLLDLRNSGDTSGYHGRVVGYGAFHFK